MTTHDGYRQLWPLGRGGRLATPVSDRQRPATAVIGGYQRGNWGVCPICCRRIRTVVPKGGDGSENRPARHKMPDAGASGGWCEGWLYEALPMDPAR